MKILIAPDKFKGSLSALEVCLAIRKGLKNIKPSLDITYHPMADGGDGSLEVISNHLSLNEILLKTVDPLHRPVAAKYFTTPNAAFIELASASGLVLLSQEERSPLSTSTQGTGLLIKHAIEKGHKHIYLFLGGSATNDAGMGIAAVLGTQFLDKDNQLLEPTGKNLPLVYSFNQQPLFDISKVKITLLCDVSNPLFGPDGAAQVYAHQKGATNTQIKYLDEGLKHFSHIVQKHTGKDVSNIPGSGAAGGVAASLVSLYDAEIKSGFDTIAELTDLEQQLIAADLIISGEGKLDTQSLEGKVVGCMGKLCQKHQKPLILFVGKNELSLPEIQKMGAIKAIAIIDHSNSHEDAMINATAYLEDMAFQLKNQLVL